MPVPVWFTWDGRTLYFATHESSQKARNLERQAWLVIHAGDGDDVIILEVQRTATGQGGETMNASKPHVFVITSHDLVRHRRCEDTGRHRAHHGCTSCPGCCYNSAGLAELGG
jgi:hypothetical protein